MRNEARLRDSQKTGQNANWEPRHREDFQLAADGAPAVVTHVENERNVTADKLLQIVGS